MKNKKGFTLIELLAVIVILGLLLGIAIPNVLKIISDKKEDIYNTTTKELEETAKKYLSDNINLYNEIDTNGFIDINVHTLCIADYISCEIIDPRDKSIIDGYVEVTNINDDYVYSFVRINNSTPHSTGITVTLNNNNGQQESILGTNYETGNAITLDTPTYNGYEFKGFNIVSGDATINGNTLKVGTEDVVVYAKWSKYTALSVEPNDGNITQNFEDGYYTGTAITLNNPTRTGYNFSGWEIVNGNSIISGNTLIMGTKDTTIKPLWEAINYKITYILNEGGLAIPNPLRYNIESDSIALNNPTRAGYIFNGWTGSNGTTPQFEVTLQHGNYGDKNYTANWEKDLTTNSITCVAGEYLKGDDNTCQDCPGGGVYCLGGTFTPNGSDQGKSNCPSGYTKSDISASTNTKCYISVADGYYKTTLTESTTAKCAVGSYSVAHDSYYNATDSCTICIEGTTTSQVGQTSCNASCNSSNVTAWNTPSWNNNEPTNICSIKTCATGYEVKNNVCSLVTYTISYTLNSGTVATANPTSYNITSNAITLNNPTRTGYTFAGWTGKSITCAAGKYLRASDATCQACPGEGVYCPGGTFTFNGNDQGKTACPNGYTKSDASASVNTKCYIEVAAGKYKTTATGSTTTNCAAGTYKAKHNSYYNSSDSCSNCTGRTKYSAAGATSCSTVSSGYYTTGCTGNDKCTGQTQCAAGSYCVNGVSTACAKGSYTNAKGKTACTACQPSGAAGANGTTSGTGQTSCNASCGKSNASTWNTASWSANSVSSSCSIKTCAANYKVSNNTCVANTCTVYCTGDFGNNISCSKTKPSGLYAVFTCTGGKTGSIQSCWYKSVQCNGNNGTYNANAVCIEKTKTHLCSTCNPNACAGTLPQRDLGLNGSGYSCSC